MENWDDLRFLLAVANSGSMSAAARLLGTNVGTVSRRLDRLGEELGGAPFVKTPTGWKPSGPARDLVTAAASFGAALERERNQSMAAERPPTIRIAASPLVIGAILVPGLTSDTSPMGRVCLDVISRMFETGLGSYDFVVQGQRPEGGRLAVRKIGALNYGCYRWRDGPADAGWVSLSDAHRPFLAMDEAERIFGGPPVLRLASFVELFRAARVLRLPCLLPDVLARGEPMLEPVCGGEPVESVDYWALYHLSRRGDPAMQIVSDWVAAAFRASETAACPLEVGASLAAG